jgi:acetyl-CoA carboxylase biotin carboxyl carrier protein
MPKVKVDKQTIRELAELLQETGLNEIEWGEAGVNIRVARHSGPAAATSIATAPSPAAIVVASAAAAAEATADVGNHPGAIKSPMVGIVYVAPEPGAQPFVKVGDTVKAGQTVLIVEAMKTMNPIIAPRGGIVTLTLVENQQPVEYGQVMMIVE